MRKLLQVISIVLLVAGALVLFQRPAYAYADPGTGLLAIQAAGSALVATGWYLRRKIRALFDRGNVSALRTEPLPGPKEGEGSSLP